MAIDNYYKFNGDSYLLFITTKRVYYYDPVTAAMVDITGPNLLTAGSDYPVFCENAQNLFVFTNGVDRVKYWDGTGTIKDLPGLDDCSGVGGSGVNVTRCKTLLYFQNFLLLAGTTETEAGSSVDYPQRIRWSKIGNIQKWKNETNGSGQAGYGDLTDGVDWCQALRPLSNYVVAYKERSIQVLSYIGGDMVWDKRPAIMGTGLLAPKAIADLGDEHIFIGPDNIYSFDLIEPKIAGDAVAKEFFRVLDPGKNQMIVNAYLEETPETWFVFPSTASPDGNPDRAIVYNTDTKAWSWRDAPMTCFGYFNRKDNPLWDSGEDAIDTRDKEWDSGAALDNAPINLCGDAQGFLYVLDGNSKDGADMACSVRTKLFDFGNPFQLKRVKRIQFMTSREGPYNLQVRIGTTANVDEPITWSDTKTMSLNVTSPPWVDVDYTARYFMFEFGTPLKDQPFRLTGYSVYYDVRGAI